MKSGAPAWLLPQLGDGFTLLSFGDPGASSLAVDGLPVRILRVGIDVVDAQGVLADRYDGQSGTCYLIRPDQHVAARWRQFEPAKVEAALRRCLAQH
jgi:3-(3-hydroxy-phenyl)propionate hydroxylase